MSWINMRLFLSVLFGFAIVLTMGCNEQIDVLIALDHSGSMYGGRWKSATSAIKTLLLAYEREVRFGLIPWSGDCQLNDISSYAIGDLSIQKVNDIPTPTGNTPYPAILSRLQKELQSHVRDKLEGDGSRVLMVFISDGRNNCPYYDSEPVTDDTLAAQMAEIRKTSYAKSIVIGFDYESTTLKRLAREGGVEGVDSFFNANDEDSLLHIISTLINDMCECGNGAFEPSFEECDFSAPTNFQSCSSQCKLHRCTADTVVSTIHEDETVEISLLDKILVNVGLTPLANTTYHVEITNSGVHGTASTSGNGILRYEPDLDFNGEDTVACRITFPPASPYDCTLTWKINISPTNDPPRLGNDEYIVDEDSKSKFRVLSNDYDPEDNKPSSSGLSVSGSRSLHGTIEVEQNAGVILYTPDENFHGDDVFSYEVCDSDGACSNAQVKVSVRPMNDAPQAGNHEFSIDEATAMNMNELDVVMEDVDGDSDIDPDTLKLVDESDNSRTSILTTLGGQAKISDNKIHYQFTQNVVRDAFVFEICDKQGACDIGTVKVVVANVDDPPVAVDDTIQGLEGSSAVIDVLQNDYDPDTVQSGQVFKVCILLENGDVPEGSFSVDSGEGFRPQVHFNPKDYVNGLVTGRYRICSIDFDKKCDDYPDVAATQLCSNFASITVNLTATNDAPIANDDEATVDECVLSADCSSNPIDVLDNDEDPDSNGPLSYDFTYIVRKAKFGDVKKTDTGLVYTPNIHYDGNDVVHYKVCDGDPASMETLCSVAKLKIVVRQVNNPPDLQDDHVKCHYDSDALIDITLNDFEPEQDFDWESLKVVDSSVFDGTVTVIPAVVGSYINQPAQLKYSAPKGFSGNQTFEYEICDGGKLCSSCTVIGKRNCATARVVVEVTDIAMPIPAFSNNLNITEESLVSAPVTIQFNEDVHGFTEEDITFFEPKCHIYSFLDKGNGTYVFEVEADSSPLTCTMRVLRGVCFDSFENPNEKSRTLTILFNPLSSSIPSWVWGLVGTLTVVGVVGGLIFWRVARYRKKYQVGTKNLGIITDDYNTMVEDQQMGIRTHGDIDTIVTQNPLHEATHANNLVDAQMKRKAVDLQKQIKTRDMEMRLDQLEMDNADVQGFRFQSNKTDFQQTGFRREL